MSRVHCTALLVLACSWGCSKDDGPGYVPVSGIVTLDGDHVEGATVTFTPQPGEGNTGTVSMGMTDASGKFSMRTGTGKTGAAIGKHDVAIELVVTQEAPPQPTDDGLAPALPNEMSESQARKVVAGPKTLYLIPKKYSDPKTSGLTATVPSGGISDLKFELTKD